VLVFNDFHTIRLPSGLAEADAAAARQSSAAAGDEAVSCAATDASL